MYVDGDATLEESRLRLDRFTRKRQVLEDKYRIVLARLEGQLEVIRAVLDQVIVGVDQTIEIHGYVAMPSHGDTLGRPSVPADGLGAHLSVR